MLVMPEIIAESGIKGGRTMCRQHTRSPCCLKPHEADAVMQHALSEHIRRLHASITCTHMLETNKAVFRKIPYINLKNDDSAEESAVLAVALQYSCDEDVA